MNIEEIILEKKRMECWISAFAGTAGAYNCIKPETAVNWADRALQEFDKRFKKTTDGNDNGASSS